MQGESDWLVWFNLRKVGGYIFIHRLLMEHFAAQWKAGG